ncbi:phosphotransferase [Paenibacillus sp. PL2-23]|uniref:phosphotransferase enzyme family protein n=1 Tax=Paenibacillus sp. PL2-23 TaxID=2100729 RepID=UPI0030F72EA1
MEHAYNHGALEAETMPAIERLMARHWPQSAGYIEPKSGGWNNSTYILQSASGRSVLRLYNTHRDLDKITFEHSVLKCLAGNGLSFFVPEPIESREGGTVARVEDGSGRFACLFRFIEGAPAEGDTADYARSFGQAAGSLTLALAEADPGLPAVYPPYYRLMEAYPACSPEAVREFCRRPPEPFQQLEKELAVLEEAYTLATISLEGLERLPHQLVHGDLNGSNLLLQSTSLDQVEALLDFEFCTRDIRAMEAAVILSGMLGGGREREAVRLFCEGYAEAVQLLPEEIDALPLLLRLRMVDVFLHFLSRYWNGTDQSPILIHHIKEQAASLMELESKAWLSEELQLLRNRYLA